MGEDGYMVFLFFCSEQFEVGLDMNSGRVCIVIQLMIVLYQCMFLMLLVIVLSWNIFFYLIGDKKCDVLNDVLVNVLVVEKFIVVVVNVVQVILKWVLQENSMNL